MILSKNTWWAVILGIAAIQSTLLVKLMQMNEPSTGLFIAITVITVLLLLGLRIQDIETIATGKDGIQATLRTLEQEVSQVNTKIEENKARVDNAFLLSMGDKMYGNLLKLASNNFGHYKKTPGGGFDDELHHLRNIGYIKVVNDSFGSFPEEGEELSDHIEVTATGREFIQLREGVTSKAPDKPI